MGRIFSLRQELHGRDSSQKMPLACLGTFQQGLDVAKEGWFTELSAMWPGQGLSLQIEKIIYQGRSQFQVLHASKCDTEVLREI